MVRSVTNGKYVLHIVKFILQNVKYTLHDKL